MLLLRRQGMDVGWAKDGMDLPLAVAVDMNQTRDLATFLGSWTAFVSSIVRSAPNTSMR